MVVHNHNLITWSWDKVIPSSRPAWAIKQDCLKKNNKKFQNEKHLSNKSCRWYFQMHLTGHNNNRILCLSWACIAFASLYAVGQREYNFNISQKSEYQDDKKNIQHVIPVEPWVLNYSMKRFSLHYSIINVPNILHSTSNSHHAWAPTDFTLYRLGNRLKLSLFHTPLTWQPRGSSA